MKVARFLGFDLSTTALSCGVCDAKGHEDFVSVPMRGKLLFHGQPAHDLARIPGMILEALKELQKRGWSFKKNGKSCALSFSVRQHDMVLLDGGKQPLMPALSWQCNVAEQQTVALNLLPSIINIVGKVESRFILPKLLWVLGKFPETAAKVAIVMTTGDYIAGYLANNFCLGTSDGLSNGLLNQRTKELAKNALAMACEAVLGSTVGSGFFVTLFPETIQSGKVIGQVYRHSVSFFPEWIELCKILQGWDVVAGLGDNHAGGIGCGLKDNRTIIVSAGSSGTVIRKCKPSMRLIGEASCFEYFDDRLLLMMLADCATWYDRFARRYCGLISESERPNLKYLDQLATTINPHNLVFWDSRKRDQIVVLNECSNPEMVAKAQFSIAMELLARVRDILGEVDDKAPKVKKFVLTGGISRSPFFQTVMTAGIEILAKGAKVLVSSREGPLASQAATLGAMINAMVGSGYYKDLTAAIADLCPLKPAVKVVRMPPSSEHLYRAIVDTLAKL